MFGGGASDLGVRHQNMKYKSPYKPQEIFDILQEQTGLLPNVMKCLISLNSHYYKGTAPVCGIVNKSKFELRNRKGPYWSLRVNGLISECGNGSEINISYSKPLFPDLLGFLFNRFKYDKQIILNFLREWIKIEGNAEPGGSLDAENGCGADAASF
jgi:hypothetical protein